MSRIVDSRPPEWGQVRQGSTAQVASHGPSVGRGPRLPDEEHHERPKFDNGHCLSRENLVNVGQLCLHMWGKRIFPQCLPLFVPRGFHLKIARVRGYTYAQLARSIREGHTVRTEVISFGRVTPEQIENLRRWIATDPLVPPKPTGSPADFDQLAVRQSWSYGRVALGHLLWRKLGFHQLAHRDLGSCAAEGPGRRSPRDDRPEPADDPTSKYGLLDWL